MSKKVDAELFESTVNVWKRGGKSDNLRKEAEGCAVEIGAASTPAATAWLSNVSLDALRIMAKSIADYWVRNLKAWNAAVSKGDEDEQRAIQDAAAGTNGLWALSDCLTEIDNRPLRKTADGLPPGADFAVGEPAWVARLEGKLDRLVKALPQA